MSNLDQLVEAARLDAVFIEDLLGENHKEWDIDYNMLLIITFLATHKDDLNDASKRVATLRALYSFMRNETSWTDISRVISTLMKHYDSINILETIILLCDELDFTRHDCGFIMGALVGSIVGMNYRTNLYYDVTYRADFESLTKKFFELLEKITLYPIQFIPFELKESFKRFSSELSVVLKKPLLVSIFNKR